LSPRAYVYLYVYARQAVKGLWTEKYTILDCTKAAKTAKHRWTKGRNAWPIRGH